MQSLAVVVLLVALGAAHAQIIVNEQCPSVELQGNFEPSKLYGLWYESRRYFSPVEDSARCITAEYSPSEYGVLDIEYNFIESSGREAILQGTAYYVGENNVADFTVLFKSGNSLPYSILSTDYENYIIFYRCLPTNSGSTRNVWVLTKNQNDESAVDSALEILKSNNLSTEALIVSNQAGCQ